MEKRMVSGILDSIKTLTVGELMELVKACEKEFNVSAALKPVIIQNPGNPGIKQTEFNVELTEFGKQRVKVLKAVREVMGLGLREAKEFVDAVPGNIKEGVSIEEAEALKAKFEELGAVITLK